MNSVFYPLQDLSRWALQLALATALFAALSISQAKAVELKPISINSASHSSASSDSQWMNDEQVESQQTSPAEDSAEKKARHEERMAQEIAKEVVNNVMAQLPHDGHSDFFNGSTFSLALLIPILAITFAVGGPIFIILYLIRARYQTKQKRLEVINTNIDKLIAAGRDIPPELLRGESPLVSNYTEMLHGGIKNLFLGIGLLIFLTLFFNIAFGAIGFIVMAVGLSQLAIWKLSAPKPGANVNNSFGINNGNTSSSNSVDKTTPDNLF